MTVQWLMPFSTPPFRAPWECPRCLAMNAPHVDRCSCLAPWPAATGTEPPSLPTTGDPPPEMEPTTMCAEQESE